MEMSNVKQDARHLVDNLPYVGRSHQVIPGSAVRQAVDSGLDDGTPAVYWMSAKYAPNSDSAG